MKDWEVRKVNELYTQIDALKHENEQLKTRVFERSGAYDAITERLTRIDDRVRAQAEQIEQILSNTRCCDDTTSKKRATGSRKTK
jgi:predicted nuclease with TOPRIM domain